MARLLFVNSTAVHGGAEDALLMLMRACAELGYIPFLLVPRRGWLTDRAAALGIEAHTLPALPDAIHVRRAWQQFLPLPFTVACLCELIGRLRVDAVHSNSLRTAYHAGIAARIMGVRAIMHVHDIVNVPYMHERRGKLLCRVSDRTIVPSEAVARSLGSAPGGGPRPIQILYNGRLAEEYETAPADLRAEINAPADAFIVGNVSVMNAFKGQDHAIRAFAELHRRHVHCRLVIVGDGQGGENRTSGKRTCTNSCAR
jgi:glycosyltransferase involved in cell wall biosynthesis